MPRGPGEIQKKILLLLLAGLALGLTRSPKGQLKIIRGVKRSWKLIKKESQFDLQRSIKRLYQSKLVSGKDNPDGSITLVLSDKGKMKALTYRYGQMKIKKTQSWDGDWRLAMFDIPEKRREARDALRFQLKQLGFYELQKSVFIIPYHCQDELDFIIEFYNIRKYVRIGKLTEIDNELDLKKYFNLLK